MSYFYKIENSFDGAALFNKDSGLPISTKEEKEVHGIGLKNIRKCAVKYRGDMDCIVKNKLLGLCKENQDEKDQFSFFILKLSGHLKNLYSK